MKIENISKMDNKDVKKNIGQLGLKVSGDTVILNTKEIIYCSSIIFI